MAAWVQVPKQAGGNALCSAQRHRAACLNHADWSCCPRLVLICRRQEVGEKQIPALSYPSSTSFLSTGSSQVCAEFSFSLGREARSTQHGEGLIAPQQHPENQIISFHASSLTTSPQDSPLSCFLTWKMQMRINLKKKRENRPPVPSSGKQPQYHIYLSLRWHFCSPQRRWWHACPSVPGVLVYSKNFAGGFANLCQLNPGCCAVVRGLCCSPWSPWNV